MIDEKVHLTFKTKRSTSEILKMIAHKLNMTQPELIASICEDFIELVENTAKKAIKENEKSHNPETEE